MLWACLRLGDKATAMKLFERACEINQDNADLFREAGLTAIDLNEHSTAIKYLDRAIHLEPDDAGLITNMALAHLFDENPVEAKRAADYALSVEPENPIIRKIVEETPNLRFDRSHFTRIGESALEFETVFWVTSADYATYKDATQLVNLGIVRQFAENGIAFAFPTHTVMVAGGGDATPAVVAGAAVPVAQVARDGTST